MIRRPERMLWGPVTFLPLACSTTVAVEPRCSAERVRSGGSLVESDQQPESRGLLVAQRAEGAGAMRTVFYGLAQALSGVLSGGRLSVAYRSPT